MVVGLLLLNPRIPRRPLSLILLSLRQLYLFLFEAAAAPYRVFDTFAFCFFALFLTEHCSLTILLNRFICPPNFYLIRQFDLFNFAVESFAVSDGLSELIINLIISSGIIFIIWIEKHFLHLYLMRIQLFLHFHSSLHLDFSLFKVYLVLNSIAVVEDLRLAIIDVLS